MNRYAAGQDVPAVSWMAVATFPRKRLVKQGTSCFRGDVTSYLVVTVRPVGGRRARVAWLYRKDRRCRFSLRRTVEIAAVRHGRCGYLVNLDADPGVMRLSPAECSRPPEEIKDEFLPAFLGYYRRYRGYGFWAAIERQPGVPGMVSFPAA
jgi:hypothetical protein